MMKTLIGVETCSKYRAIKSKSIKRNNSTRNKKKIHAVGCVEKHLGFN